MKQVQLDMFGRDPRPETRDPKTGELVSAKPVRPKRHRRPRQAKKAPMLVDAYVQTDDGRRARDEGRRDVRTSGRQDVRVSGCQDVTSLVLATEGSGRPSSLVEETSHIYTVSEVTELLKGVVDRSFSDLWVVGEVTDFRGRNGPHLYFSLKDEQGNKLRIVVFGAERVVAFEIKDGMALVAHGRLNVYGRASQYSLLADYLEPKGIGALQLAFEQLKKRLEAEGLFDRARKRPLPFLPRKIGVVTSPTGAAIRDIVHVLTRRFPNIEVLLYPVRVQGDGAAADIAQAIGAMNLREDIDLLIVGRGGGSIEDLWAFNEEIVARAIFSSRIPVISAVGHEIDFTIADFVADFRAATPSAAAEHAVPVKGDLTLAIEEDRQRLALALRQFIVNRGNELKKLCGRLIDPRRRLPDLMLRVDGLRKQCIFASKVGMDRHSQHLAKLMSNLDHLSPLAVMAKGYAVVTDPNGRAVTSSKSLRIGADLGIRFHKGFAGAKVTKIID